MENRRVVYIEKAKYVIQKEYCGFKIYQEKTPSGYFHNQSWLITNSNGVKLEISSSNDICIEELLDMIDNYKETNKFGIKALVKDDGLLVMVKGNGLEV